MTCARAAWLTVVVILSACVGTDRTAPTEPAAAPGSGPGLPGIQFAPGDIFGTFVLPGPPNNNVATPTQSTGIVLPPGAPVKVTVSGLLHFEANPGFPDCARNPVPPLPGGLTDVGPAGFDQGNRPYAVVMGLGDATHPPSSAFALHPLQATANPVIAFTQGPGVIWAGRPVVIFGGCEGPGTPFQTAYFVSGSQTIIAEELPPAVLVPDKTSIGVADTVTFQLEVSWTSNYFILGPWSWVPDAAGPSASRFIAGCGREETCTVEIHERGHARLDGIVAEGAISLTAVSPVIEVITDTLKVELQLSRNSVHPVLAPCFDAVSQTAYGTIPRRQREPGQHPCDPAGARTRAMRSDWVNVSVRTYFSPSGRPADGGALTLTAVVQPGSGGHRHGLGSFGRPVGTFLQSGQDVSSDGRPGGFEGFLTLTLSESGEAQAVYRTSGVSGSEQIRATVASRGQQAADSDSVAIRIDALQELAGGGNIARIGIRPEHPQSHWGTGGMAAALSQLADALASLARTIELLPPPGQSAFGRFPGILGVNDMSLPRGGLLDIEAAWANPHMLHRRGLDADVDVRRGSDDDFYARAVSVIWVARMGHTLTDERAALNHYHLTF